MGESKSTVYLAVAGEGKNKSLIDGTRALYKAMKMPVKKNSLVAVKLHFGEMGTTSFLRPIFVGAVVEEIKSAGGKPFLTDTNTLYTGTRSNAVEHIQTAMRHGFVPPTVDAPIIIGDGLKGKDIDIVPFEGGKHLKRALLGTAIFQADNMVALSHFKGHEMTGFGGAIKNIGMGIGSRAGKEMMHGDTKLQVDPEKCIGCNACVENCPVKAVSMIRPSQKDKAKEQKARIDQEICIGCGECLAMCPVRAIKGGRSVWGGSFAEIQEKIAEYAWAFMQDRKDKSCFLNFVMDITPRCDCFSYSGSPIAHDVGVLASRDPVALDQACVDLVVEREGRDPFKATNKIDWSIQLEHGEKLGLGSREYKLKKL